jgi:hypothetical protein
MAPGKAPHTGISRRVSLGKDGWFLAMRKGRALGPYPSADAALAAARDLSERLIGLRCDAATRVVDAFINEQGRRLTI